MINLTIDEITYLHEKLIQKTGDISGIRDIGMLESAVYSAKQSFGDEEVYPIPIERAARLAYYVITNHLFMDGNKRTGMSVMLMTLKLNHIEIEYTQQELICLGLSVADRSNGYGVILKWIIVQQMYIILSWP
ncbi:type II toxin-antitoxin system death-on-curing family toxin [Eisenbergiella tayi]|uniref:Type II toxin-antitoxin system death-on-curing family toxin n=1 Tax=Eisenbergiella porci TaxID=2652274 RepID=A0A6N7WGC9_9FIRM|nr:type II toxin-antitoxin system death-on-curing family toxin [Eisenbergiella porci]